MALMTYQTQAFVTDIPSFVVDGGTLVEQGRARFRVDQPYQIAVLSDFCNECGNCVTACPTSGKPYQDKPRLYLDRDEFDAESSNAFMVKRDDEVVTVLSRFDGATHRLSINGSVEYTSPEVLASFDEAFELVSATPGAAAADGDSVSLTAAATMYAVWKGLDESMPYLPIVDSAGTRIGQPAYTG